MTYDITYFLFYLGVNAIVQFSALRFVAAQCQRANAIRC